MASRRKKRVEEHPDERWLVTYADVLTLMFVLFMVLFSISVVNTSKFDLLKRTLQDAFSSGLIAGGAICGIVVAAIAGAKGSAEWLAETVGLHHLLGSFATSSIVGLIFFAVLGTILYRVGLRKQ